MQSPYTGFTFTHDGKHRTAFLRRHEHPGISCAQHVLVMCSLSWSCASLHVACLREMWTHRAEQHGSKVLYIHTPQQRWEGSTCMHDPRPMAIVRGGISVYNKTTIRKFNKLLLGMDNWQFVRSWSSLSVCGVFHGIHVVGCLSFPGEFPTR